jgi:TPR repeat protein
MARLPLSAFAYFATSALLCAQQPAVKPKIVVPENRPQKVQFRPYKAVHVLTIGINKYNSTGYAELRAAEADAIAVAGAFRDRYRFQVAEPLLGAKATKSAILKVLSQYQQTLSEDDALIVFFAGHGESVGIENNLHGFLIPVDARVDPNDKRDMKEWATQAIDMQELGAIVNAMKSRHVLLMIDACYSGFFGSRSGGISGRFDLDLLLSAKSRLALTAGTKQQRAFEASGLANSLFTTVLLENLTVSNAFSARELALNVRKGVMNLSKGAMQPLLRELAPELYGEFVFIPQSVEVAGNEAYLEKLITFLRSRGSGATTSHDVYDVITSQDYRYGANPEEEQARWQASIKRFEDNATLGDPLAMAGLSLALAKGLGTEENPIEAHRWALESFYSDRHPAGLYALARSYQSGTGVTKNAVAADRLLRESSDQGFAPAMNELAYQILNRKGSPPEELSSAVRLLEKAVDAGFALAKVNLASAYYGVHSGLPKDPRKVFELTRAAAEAGVPLGMSNMAWMYYRGYAPFAPPDPATARQWLQKAADTGYANAQFMLAVAHYQKGDYNYISLGFPKDLRAARRWAEMSAQQGKPESMTLLSVMSQQGDGSTADPELALSWVEKAAALGDGDAFAQQAIWYFDGTLYPRDDTIGFSKAKQAADLGSPRGMYTLGLYYERAHAQQRADAANRGTVPGIDLMDITTRDTARDAVHWYIQSARAGHEGAKAKLPDFVRRLQAMHPSILEHLGKKYPQSFQLWSRMQAK